MSFRTMIQHWLNPPGVPGYPAPLPGYPPSPRPRNGTVARYIAYGAGGALLTLLAGRYLLPSGAPPAPSAQQTQLQQAPAYAIPWDEVLEITDNVVRYTGQDADRTLADSRGFRRDASFILVQARSLKTGDTHLFAVHEDTPSRPAHENVGWNYQAIRRANIGDRVRLVRDFPRGRPDLGFGEVRVNPDIFKYPAIEVPEDAFVPVEVTTLH